MSVEPGGRLLKVEPAPPPRRLSADLRNLLEIAGGRSLTLGELEAILEGRGVAIFLILLALPFTFPIPLPGLSVPFGIVIMLMGIRIAWGRKPSLPAFITKRIVGAEALEKTLTIGLRLSVKLEKVIKPRMHFLQRWPGMINLIGLGIATAGFLMCLPLPIPFSNGVPAIAVVFLAAGMIERDGLLVLIGHLANLAGWIYVACMAAVIHRSALHLWNLLGF